MDESDLSTETDWIRRCQCGDKEAFGLLVKKYMKQAYYAALSILGTHEDALVSIGAAVVLAYAAFQAITNLIADTTIPGVLKIGIAALLLGVAVLAVSVFREKWFARKSDTYRKVIR
jgi:hypothetical protein